MKAYLKIIIVGLFLLAFAVSCRKAKEGNSYIIKFENNSGGVSYRVFKIVEFTQTKLKVINTNLTYKPEYVFEINKKEIVGTISEINNEMTYCPFADTVNYILTGTITRKKMSGTFKSTSTC